MFDIGFFEMLLIAMVGLLVIGPERLPETVRSIGLWVGRLKRSLRDTRSDIERQIGADDIRRELHNEEIMRSLENTRRDLERAAQEGGSDPAPDTIEEAGQNIPEKADRTRGETSGEADEPPAKPTDSSS